MLEDKNNDLLKRLRLDDQAALKVIFQEHYPTVYRAIYRIVSDQGIAEDLAQDVFMRFWEKRHKINIQGAIGAYIRRMAVNEALGYIRKHKKYTIEEMADHHSSATTSGEDMYMDNELQAQVNKAIDTLPPKCKTVFMLSRFEELSYKEISQKLDISPKTVENQISKALKTLRTALKTYLSSIVYILSFFLFYN
ncbi:RNA polymerase sigma factor [Aureispira anguillae]|uniref:RNA polymerase sigma-70 factor n=1 Tax=Aureispira anguillae TaxID=2864201 RepID=A0A915YB69_9BACT|nr:RNA polymerase sigma-70 factor [Aureispira anguillae]BDS09862.1 RNA polymerase sigma-70 factor [Aureispira anguillae]